MAAVAPGAPAGRPADAAEPAGPPSFHRGRAAVGAGQAPPLQTTAEYPPDLRAHAERVLGGDRPARPPRAVRREQLRRGGGWTWIGGTFAFVCWGVWAISTRGADVTTPALGLAVLIAVAAGVFGLARLLGAVLLERTLGRTRRGAWGAHLATGVFCAASGVAYLAQTQWLVEAWQFVRNLP
ncbi:MAG TPA: hypothetical protein VFY17_09245 [Pilimelia sp.]|nr:hypothetical protein [Pilimelia sp.]